MAAPTVFVSSTFYDLRYARESLKRFIEQLGYVPVLSEEGAVFFDPATTAAESCLHEVGNADMLVLLIGGRYGSLMPEAGDSVTNAEYQQAIKDKIPVFALVEQGTYNDYFVYSANSHDKDLLERLTFPNADSAKIFEFIDSVRARSYNDALVPFRTLSEIEDYLRAQWAGMVHEHLKTAARGAQVVDTLEVLTNISSRVEVIASQILKTVGTPIDAVYVSLLQATMTSPATDALRYLGEVKPGTILKWSTAEDCANAIGTPLRDYEDPTKNENEHIVSSSGQITRPRRRRLEEDYSELRKELLELLETGGVTPSDILAYEEAGATSKSSTKDATTTQG